MTEWFERWFGEEYLRLYPHRDERDAAEAVSLVATIAELDGARVLDLACGPGRHAVRLMAHGARVVGFDLSMPLLSRARHGSPPVDRLVRGDMRRLPFRERRFDVIVNLFTSFGYFGDDRQHLAVLAGATDTLRPGGTLVLDYLNADLVRQKLIPHEEQVVGSQRVAIERRIAENGRFVEKEMHIVDEGRRFLERVRLFTIGDFDALFDQAGLDVTRHLGDYAGSAWSPDSPRTIMVGHRR